MNELRLEQMTSNKDIFQEDIRTLLSFTVSYPNEEKLTKLLTSYITDSYLKLFLCRGPKGHLMALVGVEEHAKGITIRHLSISPEVKYLGMGQWLIDHLIEITKPASIYTETDDESAVEFYRRLGFKVEEIPSTDPSSQKFGCLLVL
jgi:ribosomal protein S18 acetylase RimI-like enzyme